MTPEERTQACQEGRVEIVDGRLVAWLWSPSIGGYVAHVRATLATAEDRAAVAYLGIAADPRFDVVVFHDGEFPIGDDESDGHSIEVHACGVSQWLVAAAQLAKLNGLDEDDVLDVVREAFRTQKATP